MEQTYSLNSLENINFIAARFLEDNKDSRVFAFYGEMGAGKTTFIKALCEVLGTKAGTKSPTFSLVNIYPLKETVVYHIDCYRLQSESEFLTLGYEDYFLGNKYCFIEWAEKIENFLPDYTVRVYIETENSNSRTIHCKLNKS